MHMYPAKHRSQSHKGKQDAYLQCNPFTMYLNIFRVFYTLINMGQETGLKLQTMTKKETLKW